jgi:hypothetical protein
MSRNLNRALRLLCCLAAAAPLAFGLRTAKADILSVVTSSSNVNIGLSVGAFIDDEGNTNNPDTGNPYAPGDTNPDDGNPVTFFSLGNAVGQGDPSVPPSVLGPFGVTPVLSNGLTTSLNGTVDVTPGGFSINSANLGLNLSGAWQPGNGVDVTGPPAPGELGAFVDLGNVIPGEYLLASLNSTLLSVNTSGPLSLDGLGNFSDSNGTLNLVSTTLAGFAAGPLAAPVNTTITNQASTTTLAGNYSVVGGVPTLNLPFSATSYTNLQPSTGLALYAQITESGTVVATQVPEPGTFVLMAGALVGACVYRFRRTRR